MVRHQSACPMMAYLLHRLQLRFEPMPGPFADYAYRGSLLHEALLQLFIGQVGKPGLPPISEIPVAVDRALKNRNAHFRLAPLALEAECLRLRSVLREWLEYDGQRACFVVAALEEKHSLDVQGLELEIRLDRVDRLDDGRRLIVDYKSGVVDVSGWVRNRIEEPQLPLYAILLDRERIHSVAGLALASVRMGGCRLAGIVDHPGAAFRTLYSPDNSRSVFGRRFDTWEKLFEHWRSGINGLLEEIVAGHAPNCLYQEKALKYAGLEPVLRRSEGEAWLLAHGALGSGPHGAWEDD